MAVLSSPTVDAAPAGVALSKAAGRGMVIFGEVETLFFAACREREEDELRRMGRVVLLHRRGDSDIYSIDQHPSDFKKMPKCRLTLQLEVNCPPADRRCVLKLTAQGHECRGGAASCIGFQLGKSGNMHHLDMHAYSAEISSLSLSRHFKS